MFYLLRRRAICTLGVMCPFFIGILIHNLELYLCIICNCFPHSVHNVFVKCFLEDKYGANQDSQF